MVKRSDISPSAGSAASAYDCVIVANGLFPVSEQPLAMLRQAPYLIACDGATVSLHAAGYTPDAIVGDLDSLPAALRQHYADRLHPVADQEINDLTKAVVYARSQGFRRVLLLGATGLREDHTLGNISLLADYVSWFDRIEILSDYGRFTALTRSATLQSRPGQQVSLFSLDPQSPLTTEGLRWPLRNRCLTSWWQGTLNETTGDTFTLTLPPGGRVIVYLETPRRFSNSLTTLPPLTPLTT